MHCKTCKRKPHEILEYVMAAEANDMTPEGFVWSEEGTLNIITKEFYCTDCYIKAGMPVGTA